MSKLIIGIAISMILSLGIIIAQDCPCIPNGPSSAIKCSALAVNVPAGGTNTTLQSLINSNPINTAFCLKSGSQFRFTGSVTPKSGNTFTGEFGATIDGTGWSTTDTSQAPFRSQNQDIDNVTISNLVIRNMPQKGLQIAGANPTGWTLEHLEVYNVPRGVEIGSSTLRYSKVHDASIGCYTAYQATGTTLDSNEFWACGNESKFVGTTGVTVKKNNFHNNINGPWFDAYNINTLIEDNIVRDNTKNGILIEISGRNVSGTNGTIVIRRNTVERAAGGAGIFISTSSNVTAYENVVKDNFRAIQYYLNTNATQWPSRAEDLKDNDVYDNTITVPTTTGAWANAFSHTSNAIPSDLVPYLNGSKNLLFRHNTYLVPNVTLTYWRWGTNNAKTFTNWQAIPQDATGTVGPRP